MDQALKEYIASLKPEGFPDGNALVKEGMEMAKDIPWNKSRFLKEYGYESHLEYRKKNLAEGKQTYQLLMDFRRWTKNSRALRRFTSSQKEPGLKCVPCSQSPVHWWALRPNTGRVRRNRPVT